MSTQVREYSKKTIWAWATYDFANSAFFTNISTFIYATFFTKVIAENEIIGTTLWSRGVAIVSLAVAFLSPSLGALADQGGYRKRFLFLTTVVGFFATIMLYFPVPGEAVQALFWYIVACASLELGIVFYNAFLPTIAPPDKIGRISGYGWAFGYVGGLLSTLVAMVGFVSTDTPWFGFSKEAGEHIRATNLLMAAWLAVFSIPAFLRLQEKRVPLSGRAKIMASAYKRLLQTFHEIRRYREIFKLLVARLFYNDGLITVFSFGGIYAAGTFGFTFEEIMVFGIVLNIAAGIGAFALGFLDDYLGGKRTIQITLLGFILAAVISVLTHSKAMFWVAGILIGIFSGPNQAASRSLLGRFVPPEKENEFYGFYAFSGKATAFLGPILLGLVTDAFQSQRLGMASVALFFIVGSILLQAVKESEGIRQRKESIEAGKGLKNERTY